ncbi:TRAP transporter small permease [Fulvimarina endophytica]|uniref:TRAP transporter small permease protein n=1 Tax=Fulvimarina endophytica TaxID=2293836 RepID=A0A371X5P6_9HYPH|nr:TRAP transporter small permease [Fulvimarina endophytica]RFC64552.1 TRAP transporter small permease [Fulvimarina endophytica]
MRGFIAVSSAISKALGFVSALLLASAVLSVAHMVFVRYFLGQSTVWQTEYTIYAIVCATFLGAPWTLLVRGHVNVDLLQIASPPKLRLVLQVLSGLASLLFAGLLAYATSFYLMETWEYGWRSETVWAVPLWIPTLPMAAGFIMLSVQYVAEILRLFLDGPDVPESPLADQTELFSETTKTAEASR